LTFSTEPSKFVNIQDNASHLSLSEKRLRTGQILVLPIV
jgi:hypothetical protein